MRRRQKLRLLYLTLAAAFLLMGCQRAVYDNRPYEPDTPAPSPHEGTFTSEYGSMVFNGDGETVTIDFREDLAERLNLPAGEQAATYQFYSGFLPPHGYVDIRYDAAMNLQITVGEGESARSAMIEVGEYKDGKFYSGVNCVTADRITFFVEALAGSGDREAIDFLKS